jgi:solute carrier family 25 carnitine/acylcarnitine transporter 20/29
MVNEITDNANKKQIPDNVLSYVYLWNAFKDILSGTVGGIAQVAAGHPLDTVKVRLQTQVTVPGKPPEYAGMIDCFKKTFAHEGIRGLYKGAMSPLAGAMAHNAGLFFFYGQSKIMISSYNNRKIDNLTLGQLWQAGAITGFCVNIVEAPIDVLKCKLQAQIGKGQYSGVWDCAQKLYAQRGMVAIYQGLGATIMRNVPCFASYFWGFELVKRSLTPAGEKPTLLTTFLAGGGAGFSFWGVWYPLDIIKTRMQTDATMPQDRKYKNIADCVRKIMRNEGPSAFFKGYVPSLLRAIPVNASIFLAVTVTKRFIFGD